MSHLLFQRRELDQLRQLHRRRSHQLDRRSTKLSGTNRFKALSSKRNSRRSPARRSRRSEKGRSIGTHEFQRKKGRRSCRTLAKDAAPGTTARSDAGSATRADRSTSASNVGVITPTMAITERSFPVKGIGNYDREMLKVRRRIQRLML